ncbi:hypothetical protein PM082_015423 [Marasmius tenuissimus]|nr:hypothetical protein PM082_015423 [Marasmius tenuissimus]
MEDDALTIDALGTSFPYVWLRDSCQSEQCIHPANTQKLHQTSDIPPDIRPTAVKLEGEKGITVQWEDGHQSFFDKEFLNRHLSPETLAEFHKDASQKTWNKDQLTASDLFIQYDDVKTPSGLLRAMDQLWQYGLLFIRPTFYGELWDVQHKADSRENIAYTDLKLVFHMDLMYFANPPRYQTLHCLRNRVEGGTSAFVDALHVAQQLKELSPSDYNILTKTPVPFQYVNGGRHYHQTRPTIQLSPTGDQIEYINYGPPFQAPLLRSTPIEFYHALREFEKCLQDSRNIYRYTLQEGDAVFFDNRRVFHARTAFRDRSQGVSHGSVSRWLKGCYFEEDIMWDRARSLKSKLPAVLT